MNLKGRLSKMFQYKRGKIKQKNKEFKANASFAVQQSEIIEAALTPNRIKNQPKRISAFCTQDPWKKDVIHTNSLPFPKFTHKAEFLDMVSFITFLHFYICKISGFTKAAKDCRNPD